MKQLCLFLSLLILSIIGFTKEIKPVDDAAGIYIIKGKIFFNNSLVKNDTLYFEGADWDDRNGVNSGKKIIINNKGEFVIEIAYATPCKTGPTLEQIDSLTKQMNPERLYILYPKKRNIATYIINDWKNHLHMKTKIVNGDHIAIPDTVNMDIIFGENPLAYQSCIDYKNFELLKDYLPGLQGFSLSSVGPPLPVVTHYTDTINHVLFKHTHFYNQNEEEIKEEIEITDTTLKNSYWHWLFILPFYRRKINKIRVCQS